MCTAESELERFQERGRVFPRVHGFVRLGNGAVGANHIGDALGRRIAGVLAGAVGQAQGAVGVAQQWVGEFLFLGECCVGLLVVGAGAEYLYVFVFVTLDSITESYAFGRSATGAGAWIKPEDDGFSTVICQVYGFSGVVFD